MAILVGGGPAPGINGVIASATIEAINSGLRVIGIREGYRWLVKGDISQAVELRIADVSRVHFTGGSILRTSRTNPASDEESIARTVEALERLGVRYLICIGGDDTTFGAARIAERASGRIGVATVPKTIDNDLPLPENVPTFGFETARAFGTTIIESLMEDSRSTDRWYVVVTMGRKAGALALGIGKSAGATLTVIPEEFGSGRIDLRLVVDIIVGAIVKRLVAGHDDGVAIVAEGIAERLDLDTLPLDSLQRDAYGHVHIADIPLATFLRDRIRTTINELGIHGTVIAKDIGYELRCARPVPFDIEYTRTLGYGAVRYLLNGGSGALIALTGGSVTPVKLADLLDPATGRIRTRIVDVKSESYTVARSYMIRLNASDFEEPMLSQLAAQTRLTPREFERRFRPAVAATIAVSPAAVTVPDYDDLSRAVK
ncbi:MAG: 6-phosphofructokinase [Candidatus Binataceae bacterium]|nr:6-phosphofructokinase [Candidatus Binataceae bacterium]